ncbi:hypothetical protein CCS41_11195 [Candidatus Fukatsuia symbiotica]|uniref:Uncharacterized protein n=1 Tax=Candidatus Fukatsuia symbiotica TaxID=1878942 RepID=A0A2U8IA25_9GAMM|nr:hypothetical protein CCS41_11195 [Candidatus Fukatsuia symbiotica]
MAKTMTLKMYTLARKQTKQSNGTETPLFLFDNYHLSKGKTHIKLHQIIRIDFNRMNINITGK